MTMKRSRVFVLALLVAAAISMAAVDIMAEAEIIMAEVMAVGVWT